MTKLIKNNFWDFIACFLAFLLLLIVGWNFSDMFQILQKSLITLSFAQEFTLSTEISTSTVGSLDHISENATSSLQAEVRNPEDTMIDKIESGTDSIEVGEIEDNEDEITSLDEQGTLIFQSSSEMVKPHSLKERRFNKEVVFDNSASHSCVAKNFHIDVSRYSKTTTEIEFYGMRSDSESFEIGSLPFGIDITFLNGGGYKYHPEKNDSGVVLQIVNEEGSQKGNFSIPIIYHNSGLTTVCDINIINF